MMLVRSLIAGMNIVAVEPSSNPFETIRPDLRIDFAAIVPYQLQNILDSASGKNTLNKLKAVLVGGAPVSTKVKALLHPLQCQVYTSYGMTETISHIALQALNGPAAKDYFEVLPGISIERDARGCLTIAADYLGKDKIITNDLVEILGQRQFLWLGRWDRVINTSGVKVIPEKIEKECEKTIEALGLLHRCFVAGLPDERLGTKVGRGLGGTPFLKSPHPGFYAELGN